MAVIDDLTEKELRRLSRRDLLAMMLDMANEVDELERNLREERVRHEKETEEISRRHSEELRQLKETSAERIDFLTKRLLFEKERQRALELKKSSSKKENSAVQSLKAIFQMISRRAFSEKGERYSKEPHKKGAGK